VSDVTIYHNPNCGTSRNVLGLIRNAGIEPTVIEYLKAPPDRQTLLGFIERMGIRVRELLRRKGLPYDELELDDPKWTDDQLIDTMLANPILINRPIGLRQTTGTADSVLSRETACGLCKCDRQTRTRIPLGDQNLFPTKARKHSSDPGGEA
jgi:arsenate reductase (glutaredoxin)